MYYYAELNYLMRILKSLRLKVNWIDPYRRPAEKLDYGLRELLGWKVDYDRVVTRELHLVEDNTIYKVTDEFRCHYLYLRLPEAGGPVLLVIGPYMTFEMDHEQILEEAEHFGISGRMISRLEACFSALPVVRDEPMLFSVVNSFGEVLWGGGNAFRMIDVDREMLVPETVIEYDAEGEGPEDLMARMQMMEMRYAYENELMENVRQGHTQRTLGMLRGFPRMAFEQRVADPIRNMKNYGVICNTLLRKAAEQGGVHPLYLDRMSSEFARRIEGTMDLKDSRGLLEEMAHSYCRLVRKTAVGHYSQVIHKTVICIEADLSADLSLKKLAELQNVSAGYLSSLFHRETGKTLTAYVNEKRMEAAARLLKSTRLQVQTIAQHCGMSDVNYFAKLFKKHYGKTPKQYREERGAASGAGREPAV